MEKINTPGAEFQNHQDSFAPEIQDSPPLASAVTPVNVQVLQGQVQSQNQIQVGIFQEQLARKNIDSSTSFKHLVLAFLKTILTELCLTIIVPSRLLTLAKALSLFGLAYILFNAIPVINAAIIRLVPEINKADVLGIVEKIIEKESKNLAK